MKKEKDCKLFKEDSSVAITRLWYGCVSGASRILWDVVTLKFSGFKFRGFFPPRPVCLHAKELSLFYYLPIIRSRYGFMLFQRSLARSKTQVTPSRICTWLIFCDDNRNALFLSVYAWNLITRTGYYSHNISSDIYRIQYLQRPCRNT